LDIFRIGVLVKQPEWLTPTSHLIFIWIQVQFKTHILESNFHLTSKYKIEATDLICQSLTDQLV